MVHGYGKRIGIWTSYHEKLRKALGDFDLYLIIPELNNGKNGILEENWDKPEHHKCIGPFHESIPSEYLDENNLKNLIEYSEKHI